MRGKTKRWLAISYGFFCCLVFWILPTRNINERKYELCNSFYIKWEVSHLECKIFLVNGLSILSKPHLKHLKLFRGCWQDLLCKSIKTRALSCELSITQPLIVAIYTKVLRKQPYVIFLTLKRNKVRLVSQQYIVHIVQM